MMKMISKIALLSIIIFSLSCAMIQKQTEDRTKTCAVICGAIEGAQCWDDPNMIQALGSALSLATCIDKCEQNMIFSGSVDVQCIQNSQGCKIAECVKIKAE